MQPDHPGDYAKAPRPRALPALAAKPELAKRRPVWPIVAGAAFIVATILSITAVTLWQLRRNAEAGAEARIISLDRVVAAQAEREFQGVDLVVSGIVDELKAEGITSSQELRRRKTGPEIHQALRQKLAGLPQAEVLSLISGEGDVVNFSRFYPAPPINVADRDFFIALRDDPELQGFISEPEQNRVTGTYTIFLSHRIAAPDGTFIGIVLGAIELKYFADFYRDVNPGEGGSIALWRNDGILLARHPVVDGAIGRSFVTSPFFKNLVASNQESGLTQVIGGIQGLARIIAVRRLREFPLIATVGLDRDAVLAPWRSQAVVLGVAGVVASIAVALMTLLMLRQFVAYELVARQRAQIDFETEARQRLELALESEKAALREYERAERALRQSEHRFRDIAEVAADWIWETGPDHRFTLSGDSSQHETASRDIRHSRVRGKTRWELAGGDPDKDEKWRRHKADLDAHLPFRRFQYVTTNAMGRNLHISASGKPVFDEMGAFCGYRGTATNETELRASQQREIELERQLLHAQKLEALGTLAGGIAHDLNNTLMPILALSKLVMEEMPEVSSGHEDLETIVRASERARDLVQRILAFSRKQEMVKGKLDLAQVTREALRLLRPALPATIELVERIDAVPPLLGDPGQLQQAIVNLVTNAVQAIGNRSGKVTVAVSPAAERLPSASRKGEAAAIRLSVADTGCGIDAAILNRIFEPFFTTKNVGEGTGLGLSVAHGIIAGHGGRIDVHSARGEGSEFTVLLPVCGEDQADFPADQAMA